MVVTSNHQEITKRFYGTLMPLQMSGCFNKANLFWCNSKSMVLNTTDHLFCRYTKESSGINLNYLNIRLVLQLCTMKAHYWTQILLSMGNINLLCLHLDIRARLSLNDFDQYSHSIQILNQNKTSDNRIIESNLQNYIVWKDGYRALLMGYQMLIFPEVWLSCYLLWSSLFFFLHTVL